MSGAKLKLEEVEVESFDAGQIDGAGGTVQANQLNSAEGTCQGQTAMCTACRPLHCY